MVAIAAVTAIAASAYLPRRVVRTVTGSPHPGRTGRAPAGAGPRLPLCRAGAGARCCRRHRWGHRCCRRPGHRRCPAGWDWWRGRGAGRRRWRRRWRGDHEVRRPGMVAVVMVGHGGRRRRGGRWWRLCVRAAARGVVRCRGGAAARGQRREQCEPSRRSGEGERHDLSFSVCDLRWIGGRRAYTSDTARYWLAFSTDAASGRGVGHSTTTLATCTGVTICGNVSHKFVRES